MWRPGLDDLVFAALVGLTVCCWVLVFCVYLWGRNGF
jgi:hypothetical protein